MRKYEEASKQEAESREQNLHTKARVKSRSAEKQ